MQNVLVHALSNGASSSAKMNFTSNENIALTIPSDFGSVSAWKSKLTRAKKSLANEFGIGVLIGVIITSFILCPLFLGIFVSTWWFCVFILPMVVLVAGVAGG